MLQDPDGLPSAPLLIFNSSWPAEECPSNPDYGKYNSFCNEIVSIFLATLRSPVNPWICSSENLPQPSPSVTPASGNRGGKKAAPLEMISAGRFFIHRDTTVYVVSLRYVKNNVKAPFVGGRKSKKFPEGLEIGMFSNACGANIWTNAGQS